MYTIFEQGKGIGIGHSFNSFIKNFNSICEKHVSDGKAKSFAFIFYDFKDELIKNILKDQGVFTTLDRLSGTLLSVFYIYSEDKELINKFNDVFLYAFEIDKETSFPFVLFFNLVEREATDIEIVELENRNVHLAFNELYSIIENRISQIKYKSALDIKPVDFKYTKLIGSVKRIAIDKFINYIADKGSEYMYNNF